MRYRARVGLRSSRYKAQYAADFVKRFGANFGLDPCVPNPPIRGFGYLYLSDSESFTKVLEKDQQLQSSLGAGTQIIPPTDIKENSIGGCKTTDKKGL